VIWLKTGDPGDLASGEDGLVATRIAEAATAMAIEARWARLTGSVE